MCPLQFSDLFQPTHVAFPAVELCTQERADELAGQLRADHLRADAEDVHVVVLDALVRRVRVVADGGPDARELAGGDRGADAGAADEDPALRVTAADRIADLTRLVRVVDPRFGPIRAEVDGLVACANDLLEHALAQLHPAMVESDRDPHAGISRQSTSG